MMSNLGYGLTLVGPLLLAACGSSAQQNTAQLLERRLEARLAPDVQAKRAVVQPLPDGALVMLLDPSLFPNTADTLDNRNSDPRANIVEGLLDPRLMSVQVADTSTLPLEQRQARVKNVVEYFQVAGLGQAVQPGDAPAGAAPAGLAVMIKVRCPDTGSSAMAYDYGRAAPTCD